MNEHDKSIDKAFLHCKHIKPLIYCDICPLEEHISKLKEHHVRQIDENRKVSYKLDEIQEQINQIKSYDTDYWPRERNLLMERIAKLEEQTAWNEKIRIFNEQNLNASIKNFNKFVEKLSHQNHSVDGSQNLPSAPLTNFDSDKDLLEKCKISHESQKSLEQQAKDLGIHISQKKKTKTYWVNVYKYEGNEDLRMGYVWGSKEAAQQCDEMGKHFVKTISFEIEE